MIMVKAKATITTRMESKNSQKRDLPAERRHCHNRILVNELR